MYVAFCLLWAFFYDFNIDFFELHLSSQSFCIVLFLSLIFIEINNIKNSGFIFSQEKNLPSSD